MVFHTVRMQKMAMKRNTLQVIWGERLAVPRIREEVCWAVSQTPHSGTAAPHRLPLIAKSLLMSDLTQARGH